MHPFTLCFSVASSVTLFVVLTQAQSDNNYSPQFPESRLYPYAVKGFVQDVRHQPLRFIGSLFFKKAFILLKLKLKWKLKKKIILKKLLKKLFHFHGRKRRAATFSFPRDEEHDTRQSQLREPDGFPPLSPSQRQQYEEEYSQYFPHDQEPKDSDIMKYLAMASEFDTNGCIPKGICEVMANGNHTTNQFQNNILDYYNDDSEERQDTAGTPAYIYDQAANLGRTRSRNGRGISCSSYFPNCPDPPQQLNTFMNEVFVSEMCDAPVSNYA